MTKKQASTEVAPLKGTVTIDERKDRVGQGSQNVTADQMAIPRLKLLQKISEEVEPGNPKQVEGAAPGMIMHSLSNELYDGGLFVINLHFQFHYVAWRKRKHGGGIFGMYKTEEEAIRALEAAGEVTDHYDILDTPEHLLMLLTNDGKPNGIAMLDMAKSKSKVSRRWNSLIAAEEEKGNPRFGCVWKLGVASEQGQEGPYFNYKVELLAHAPDTIYNAAAAAYDGFFGNAKEGRVDGDTDEAA